MEKSREKLILNSLKEGRKRWSELERELVDSGKMSMSTLSARLKDLEKEKLISGLWTIRKDLLGSRTC